ncbi:MAG: hypothetical protein Q8T11_18660 [Elusimicrobiota bacterium]|nr:hypothetical protein [Elusimicrobiota bacterium]
MALRVGCAIATEYKPIFPAYYYTDANSFHAYAIRARDDIAAGRSPRINGSLSERLQTSMTLQTYRVFGARPLAIKLVNASLGALCILALTWTLSLVFPSRAALAAGALVAVWPSHVFYTSQNLKEAPADLLAYLALGAAFAAVAAPGGAYARAGALAMLTASLLGAGFYRSYVLLSISGGLLLAFALMALDRPRRAAALLGAAAVFAALSLYPWLSHQVILSFESTPLSAADIKRLAPDLIPTTHDEFDIGTVNRPNSPGGITAFRKSRQFADRRWARHTSEREIGTQIYPKAEFKTWGEVFAYLPKGAFTVLFMPLPGLYPMNGKLGRLAASGENLFLLSLAALAVAGFFRGPKAPARLGLLAFFGAMTVGAALFEFDLGSAGRHKLLYMPMLFPFAAEAALRLYHGKEPV